MIHVVATSEYVPSSARSLDELAKPEYMTASAPEWRASHRYLSEFIRSYGFEEDALVAAAASVDRDAIRETAGLDRVAVEDHLSLPEMCVEACRAVVDAESVGNLSAIVVCQTSADAQFHTNASTTLRLQCEYKFRDLAFAVEDHDGANFFVALSLLTNLCEGTGGLSRVLLCCGERWRHPFPRLLGTYTMLGDGAGAALLSTEPRSGWRLLGVETRPLQDPVHPWSFLLGNVPSPISRFARACGPEGVPSPISRFARACGLERQSAPSSRELAANIDKFLRSHGLPADRVGCIVPPHVNRGLVNDVHAHLGVPPASDVDERFGRHGYLCAADPVVRLHHAFTRIEADHASTNSLLLWGIGLNGTFGAALFVRVTVPSASH